MWRLSFDMFHDFLGHYEGVSWHTVWVKDMPHGLNTSKTRCYQHGGGALVSVTFLLPLINGILGTHMAPPVPVAMKLAVSRGLSKYLSRILP